MPPILPWRGCSDLLPTAPPLARSHPFLARYLALAFAPPRRRPDRLKTSPGTHASMRITSRNGTTR